MATEIPVIDIITNAYRTCVEMLEDRGYDVKRIPLSEEYISKQFKDERVVTIDVENDNSRSICKLVDPRIIFKTENLIKVVDTVVKKIKPNINNILILVIDNSKSKSNLNTIIEKKVQALNKEYAALPSDSPHLFIQGFKYSDLQFNVSRHYMVPKHEILSQQEIIELLTKLRTTKDKLPKILTTDPMARYLFLKVGDICKITSKSETIGEYVSYRVCDVP